MPSHQITAFHTKNQAFTAKIDGHEIRMDSTEAQGSGWGAGPKKLMLASLAGCTGIDIVSILEKMRVPFSDFSIQIEADLTEDHPKIYDKVRIVYAIRLPETDREKMQKVVLLSKEKYCGVSAMFSRFADIGWHIKFL